MNTYWPIYKNLEEEVVKLTYHIHVDDNQLNVYSSKISDLILRAAAELESLSKELYKINGGKKTDKIKYDADALEHLNALWNLDEKIVLLSAINCFQSIKEFRPFIKKEVSSFHGRNTYSWNNSYQNLKHDRAASLRFGSIKYLFDIMAALFLLNIYFKNESVPLGRDSQGVNFPINMGSILFSIKIHTMRGHDHEFNYYKSEDINECTYMIKYSDRFLESFKPATLKMGEERMNRFYKHPKFLEHYAEAVLLGSTSLKPLPELLGSEYGQILNETGKEVYALEMNMEYEAFLNKGSI